MLPMTKGFFTFAITFVALFALTYVFMGVVDALPETGNGGEPVVSERNAGPTETPAVSEGTTGSPESPTRVVAKDIGLNSRVVIPEGSDIDSLNKAVDTAAMYYPGSAMLGVDGTVLLFGHSSYLPIVNHQVYKTFNGIQNLKNGATISVYSATTEYRYSVTEVRVANATEDVVQLPATGKFLTLVTCDSFGSKSDRYVVTAEFVGQYTI